jgi:hypothetical protein
MLIAIRHDEVSGLVPAKVYDFPVGSLKVGGLDVGGGGGGGTPSGVDRDLQVGFAGSFEALTGTNRLRVAYPTGAGISHGQALGNTTELTPYGSYGVPSAPGAHVSGRINSANVDNNYAYFSAGGVGSVARGDIAAQEATGTGNATFALRVSLPWRKGMS